MSEELHEEHALSGWEGEGGHDGEGAANLQQNDADSENGAEHAPDTDLQSVAEKPQSEGPTESSFPVRLAESLGEGYRIEAEALLTDEQRDEIILSLMELDRADLETDAQPVADAGAALDIPEPEPEEPAIAAGAQPNLCTLDDLKQEYFPNSKRLSGGAAAGLQREMRRRNRREEKGY